MRSSPIAATRRGLILAPLLAALPAALLADPVHYVTDRLCFVISGTWWVDSGENFEPENTVPVSSGGFVRRVAHTPHYDGVKRGGKEPAVIGIIGMAPIELKLVDPSKPPVRECADRQPRAQSR